ncbi:MAG: YihY family inner membrane protein [Sulfurovum sp.]|nr:YihY family inner membrane protein [Sulfurovum sp.]
MKKILRNYYIFLRDFFKDLFDDQIGHYASSLSWSTLFSIIPLMVIMLWVFTMLPIFDSVYSKIEKLIFSNLMPTDSKEVMTHINTFIENSDKLGLIGIGYVLFAVFMFFKNYDYIVNSIFNTPSRTLWSAIKTYILLILAIPTMLGVSFYLSAFIQGYLDSNSITSTIHIFYFLPFLVIWAMFYIAYQLSPNSKVSAQAASISSFIASLIWYLSKSGFVFYVMHNKTYTSIYGSIGTLLFFFLWIYISWAIFLHGLKFCELLDKGEEIESI